MQDASANVLDTIPLVPPSGPIMTQAGADPSFADSYTAIVPAEYVAIGLQIKPKFDLPIDGVTTISPRVGGGKILRHVSVPIQIDQTVLMPPNDTASQLKLVMPVADFEQIDHPIYKSTKVTTLPSNDSEWDSAFSTLLNEINQLRTIEGGKNSDYYYGWIPKRGFGLVGLGFVSGRAAVGSVNANSGFTIRTMQHEIGHNLSLRHAPCGGATGTDPNYPYANGRLGSGVRFIWGYNSISKIFIDPRTSAQHDIMGYCDGAWFSDYSFRKMQAYLTPADVTSVGADREAGLVNVVTKPQAMTLLSGSIKGGRAAIDPVQSFEGLASATYRGAYLMRVTDAKGKILEYPFDVSPLDHQAGNSLFALSIPEQDSIASLEILLNGNSIGRYEAPPSLIPEKLSVGPLAMSNDELSVRELNGRLHVVWDRKPYPFLTVTHVGKSRTVLALSAKSGVVDVSLAGIDDGGTFEFSLSDGFRTRRLTRVRN